MTEIKIATDGLDVIVKQICSDLNDVMGYKPSKRAKDVAMAKAVGALSAVFCLALVEDKEEVAKDAKEGIIF